MLTCRIHAKEDLRIEDAVEPTIAQGQVLVRLGGSICGPTCTTISRTQRFVVRSRSFPGTSVGTVAKVGPGVTRVKVGDKIAVSPSHACGHCDYRREDASISVATCAFSAARACIRTSRACSANTSSWASASATRCRVT